MRALVLAAALGLGLAPSATAGIAVDAVTPQSVRAGDLLQIRVSAGLRLWKKIPLDLVPSSRALRPRACPGGRGICEPRVTNPPTGGGYTRIATVSFRRVRRQVLGVKVPRLAPGRYEVAFYCGACYRGPTGSLIANPDQAFDIVR